MKANLIDTIGVLLLKKGYTIKCLTRTCFDILARNEGKILLIKVLEDANAISEEYALQMKSLCFYIDASPIIIAEKAGAKLEDSVIYSRFGIYALNLGTFQNCLENKFPFARQSQAGLTVSVIGRKLREMREQLGYSLNSLSKKLGVSSRMISKYESEDAEVTLKRALRIYDVFGAAVFDKVNVFSQRQTATNPCKSDVSRKYVELGFDATETRKVPFNVIAKKEREIILTGVGDKPNPQAMSMSKLIDADNLMIFTRKKPKDIPALTKKEFLEFQKANELIKFVREFRK